jgi:hypothetical protein
MDPVGTEDLGISTIQRTTWIYIVSSLCMDLDITMDDTPSFSGILQYPK